MAKIANYFVLHSLLSAMRNIRLYKAYLELVFLLPVLFQIDDRGYKINYSNIVYYTKKHCLFIHIRYCRHIRTVLSELQLRRYYSFSGCLLFQISTMFIFNESILSKISD